MTLIDVKWHACCLPHDPCRCDIFLKAAFINGNKDLTIPYRDVTDVVKTRLQVEARKGQTTYKGLVDAFGKICKSTRSSYSDALIKEKIQIARKASKLFSKVDQRVLFAVLLNSGSPSWHTSIFIE